MSDTSTQDSKRPTVACGDCAHFERCAFLLQKHAEDTTCDWFPSRWRQATPKKDQT